MSALLAQPTANHSAASNASTNRCTSAAGSRSIPAAAARPAPPKRAQSCAAPAGASSGARTLTEEVFKFLRTAGPTLSAFNAWVLIKGLETLRIRIEAQSASALQLAQWLEGHPKMARVFYPGLPSHPQHELAKTQQKGGGAIVSFEVKGGREQAWQVVDNCRLLSITANLGDTKTTITHPASTTHGRITPEARAAAGISEGLLRVAVGLEAVEDLQVDLERGLSLI